MILLRRVAGESMTPTLQPGQLVVALRWRRAQAGDVVIVRHNNLEKIKRIGRLQEGKIFLLGDNPGESTDSRTFGWLPQSAVVAKVVWPNTHC